MNEKIKRGAVAFISFDKRQGIKGGLLQKRANGSVYGEEIPKEKLVLFSVLPNLVKMLDDENMMLQISRCDGEILAELGKIGYEGPYGEKKYFSIMECQKSLCVEAALVYLNQKLSEKEPKCYRLAYRQYNRLKYE